MSSTPPPLPLFEFSFSTPRMRAVVSTRHGGVSAAPHDTANVSYNVGDDPDAVTRNRERVCAALGQPLDALTMANQVHAGDVIRVHAPQRGVGSRSGIATVGDADALITDTPGIVLAVLLADCVPVVVVDPVRMVIGVAHAGWRGTMAHVVFNTVRAMVREYDCDPCDMHAGIGPSIGPRSYNVGADVVQQAAVAFAGVDDVVRHDGATTTFDLWTANRDDLLRAGVAAPRIEVAGIDTFRETSTYFSHRAQAPTGRFLAAAVMAAD